MVRLNSAPSALSTCKLAHVGCASPQSEHDVAMEIELEAGNTESLLSSCLTFFVLQRGHDCGCLLWERYVLNPEHNQHGIVPLSSHTTRAALLSKVLNGTSADRCVRPGSYPRSHLLAASQPTDMGQGYLTMCHRTVGSALSLPSWDELKPMSCGCACCVLQEEHRSRTRITVFAAQSPTNLETTLLLPVPFCCRSAHGTLPSGRFPAGECCLWRFQRLSTTSSLLETTRRLPRLPRLSRTSTHNTTPPSLATRPHGAVDPPHLLSYCHRPT